MHSSVFVLSFITCSALGAALRLGLTQLAKYFFGQAFYATLCVNLLGSACIGVLYVLLHQAGQWDRNWYLLLVTGLLGSLTTFSGFSLEVAEMLLHKQWGLALIYSMSSMFFCVAVTVIAMQLTHLWFAFE